MLKQQQVIIIGAGGAGMMCAIHAGRRGRQVLLLDHGTKMGGKILISGGGRCNFTNLGASPANYVSQNPHFCKSALSRYPSESFVQMVRSHGIAFHEKKLGQLFCDESAQAIVDMLKAECEQADVEFRLHTPIQKIERILGGGVGSGPRFQIETSEGSFQCESLVIATGGLSIPKIGATGFGYQIAREFGLKVVETTPALDGFTFSDAEIRSLRELAGVSIDCVISCNGVSFRENILFTHTGLSGPAALQASLHWYTGQEVLLDLLPGVNLWDWFLRKKREGNRSLVKNLLSEVLPNRFAERFCELYFPAAQLALPLPQVSEKALEAFCQKLHAWKIIPSGTVGYNKAEVTRGGVDTDELSSKTMEVRKVPGLYFVGEVVDVTGWLGGYNFQWAWSSGWAAGQVV
ncbi:NAD(P)/FAD-dependent oxidoreductase [Bdellovibrionota bacterium FG-1]